MPPHNSKKKHDYDKRIFRLLDILNKLDRREKVHTQELADAYNVSIRSIQRDLELLSEAGFLIAPPPSIKVSMNLPKDSRLKR